jgi:hypothetical protein
MTLDFFAFVIFQIGFHACARGQPRTVILLPMPHNDGMISQCPVSLGALSEFKLRICLGKAFQVEEEV